MWSAETGPLTMFVGQPWQRPSRGSRGRRSRVRQFAHWPDATSRYLVASTFFAIHNNLGSSDDRRQVQHVSVPSAPLEHRMIVLVHSMLCSVRLWPRCTWDD